MAVPGVFASDAHIVGNRVQDFAGSLLQIMPTGSAQLLALSAGMDSMDAKDTIINWFEENHISGRANVTNIHGDADGTTISVDDSSSFPVGTILLNESTSEYVLITANNTSSNQLTLSRAIDGSAVTNFAVNHKLQRIGTAHEEGSSKPPAVANLGYAVTNYTQIFRNLWSVTGTAQAVQYHTGSAVAKNKADCAMFHSEDIERSLLWGKKAIGVRGSQPFRVMDGLYSLLTSNNTTAGATTNYDQVDAFLQSIFSKNVKGKPNERIAYCGNAALGVINGITIRQSDLNISVGQTDFGLQVTKWISPYGTISLMTHPLMTESPFYTKDLLVLHPGCMQIRWLRRTHIDGYDKDGTRAGVDADEGVYTSELSLQYSAKVTGGIFKQLTKGATL